MSLKLRLKPDEKVLIGKAVIKNGPRTSEFVVENNIPILRQKDIMTEQEADSPSRRVYFVIQLMYIDSEKLVEYHGKYWELVNDILAAAPSTKPYIEKISEQILACDYYQALKLTRKLMNYEEELLAHVKSI
ncbi:MAG: flagellar biosynthesis repressor FlbT [Geobacteraceae bacterium]|nr:flagellar biosynthesis repressor FlbT [Geobacteraceae bacterium]